MCEKRIKKIMKGTHLRMREARRLQRLQRVEEAPTSSEDSNSSCPPTVDKAAQNRLIIELAWKTAALMHKSRLIQQKIRALQKETTEFVAAVMSNPENRRRYIEHIRLYGQRSQQISQDMPGVPIKMEPCEP